MYDKITRQHIQPHSFIRVVLGLEPFMLPRSNAAIQIDMWLCFPVSMSAQTVVAPWDTQTLAVNATSATAPPSGLPLSAGAQIASVGRGYRASAMVTYHLFILLVKVSQLSIGAKIKIKRKT